MKSDYESVTAQAGIRTGKEGFDITVKENTHLKGAVIDSKAEKEKNALTTGTLSWEDVKNKAEYKGSGTGISFTTDKNARYNERGVTPAVSTGSKEKASSVTKSAVAKGTITITDKEKQKQDIAKLNRDTKDTLNQLSEIFDKKKVEENQELMGMIGKYGNQAIHRYAERKGWKDGSTEKILLHGAFGALMSDMAGDSAMTGALSGGITEYVMGYLTKTKGEDWVQDHPDTVQWIGAGVGEVIGSLSHEMDIGANISVNASKWNYLGFALVTEPLLKRTLQKSNGEPLPENEWHELSENIKNIANAQDPFGADSESLEVGNENAKEAVRSYLAEQGFTPESVNEFMNSYESLVVDLQERKSSDHISDYLSESPAAKITMDGIKEVSDSKAIKHVINGAEYIYDGYRIITSEYPGDAAYAWVIGTETTYVVANAILFAGNVLRLPSTGVLVGSVTAGVVAGDKMEEKLRNELQKERNKVIEVKENENDETVNKEKKG